MTTSPLHQLGAAARAVCPTLRVDALLHRTDKTAVLAGVLDGAPVVAKFLLDRGEFWRAKFAAEVRTYEVFAAAPPPVPVPRLCAADPAAGVLVATRLPGAPVATDRYPGPLPDTAVDVLVGAASAVSTWRPPAGALAAVWDYPQRFTRYRDRHGLFDDADHTALTAAAAAAGPLEPAHGDLLPGNVLHADTTLSGVLDWEFAGLYLPGADLALLWVLLAATPAARARIEAAAGTTMPSRAGFWVNVATLVARERRTHGELPPGPLRDTRLAGLAATWNTARTRLHQLAREV